MKFHLIDMVWATTLVFTSLPVTTGWLGVWIYGLPIDPLPYITGGFLSLLLVLYRFGDEWPWKDVETKP